MKKNSKIIIILSIVVILAVAGGIFAYLYLKTDMFKSNQELFSKYITQTVEQFQKTLDLQTVKEYKKLQSESKYELNTNIKIVNSEGGEISNPFNKLTAKLDIQKDDENQYLYGDTQILYGEEKYLEAEIIKEQGVFGVRLPDVVKQFVTIKDDEKLEEVANSIGVEASVLKEVINFFEGDNEIIPAGTVSEYKDKYLNIFVKELQKGAFAKQKDAMITYNSNTTKTNAYEVSLTNEQVKNIIIEYLTYLKGETQLLEKISIVTEENISEFIELIKDSNEIPTLKITVFEQGQNTIRTIIEIGTYKITIDNINDKDAIKNIIKLIDLNSEEDFETTIEIIKNNIEGKENFNIKIENVENGEIDTINFIIQTSISETVTNIKSKISYEQGIKVISLEIDNIINLQNDFERKKIVGTNENMLLNDLDEAKREYVINFLSQKIPEKINEKVILLMENLGFQDNDTEGITSEHENAEQIEDENQGNSENSISQEEINRFNAKFEFYTGEEVSTQNVKKLLDIVKDNLNGHAIMSVGEEENSKVNITLYIEKDNTDEESIAKILEEIKDNKKYNVSITYGDDNNLIETITIIEN